MRGNGRMGLLGLLLGGAVIASGLPAIGDSGAAVPPGVVHEVAIRDFVYTPASLTIRAGEAVRWTNYDAAPHDAVELGGAWKTPLLKQGESATQVFDRPGQQEYYCTVHPAMRGSLTVR